MVRCRCSGMSSVDSTYRVEEREAVSVAVETGYELDGGERAGNIHDDPCTAKCHLWSAIANRRAVVAWLVGLGIRLQKLRK
jgi:hypothetical protein